MEQAIARRRTLNGSPRPDAKFSCDTRCAEAGAAGAASPTAAASSKPPPLTLPEHQNVWLRRHRCSGPLALLAPLVRPLPKQPELLKECLETLAAAIRDCTSNQVAFDKFVPQLVPLLRSKSTLPYEILKASVKVLGAMAHRVSARKIMYDAESAEGVMHVLSHPDSSQARPAS